MAQSKRKRKVKARRQAAQAQRQRGRERHQAAEQAAREARRRAAQLFDPATPVDVVAQLLSDALDGRPTRPGFARLLEHVRGNDGVLAIAKRLCEISVDDGSPSLTALALSAEAHYLAGEWGEARSALDAALGRASDESDRQELACHLGHQGRPSECVEQLGTWLTEFPADPDMAATFGYAIEDIHSRLTSTPPEGECPCGSGHAWSGCCQDRDAATLARFGRRDNVTSLHSAMRDFVAGSQYEDPVAEHVAEWQSMSDADLWDDGARRAIDLLALEHSWVVAGVSDDEEDDDSPLKALCASERTDPDISADARTWLDEARYGLWQVDGDPSAGPPTGVHVTELCTGQSLYVALPQPLKAKLARWSVLMGAVVPLDGAWRFSTATVAATPTEADALIEVVQAATTSLVHALSGEPMPHPPTTAPIGRAEPHSVYAYEDGPAEESLAPVINRVVGTVTPRLLGDVHQARATPPTLTNTDGDLMEMISARVAVDDTAALLERLSRHEDFEVHEESVTWLGSEVPAAQLETMRAEVEAQFGSQPSEPDEPQRWVRGTLTQADGQLRIEVNSRARLERLLYVLDDCGAGPVVVDESHIDPRQDLAWPAEHRPALGGMAAEGWEKHWLDESVPALGGTTPREAAESEFRPHLERMLRQFEYDADICRLAGEKGVDTDWLRDALDMIEY